MSEDDREALLESARRAGERQAVEIPEKDEESLAEMIMRGLQVIRVDVVGGEPIPGERRRSLSRRVSEPLWFLKTFWISLSSIAPSTGAARLLLPVRVPDPASRDTPQTLSLRP